MLRELRDPLACGNTLVERMNQQSDWSVYSFGPIKRKAPRGIDRNPFWFKALAVSYLRARLSAAPLKLQPLAKGT